MKKRLARWLLLLGLVASVPAMGDDMMMVRSQQPFGDAMNTLLRAAGDRGYTTARVQRVDVGLKSRGYQTAEYRLVFIGKPEEVAAIGSAHPQLLPYLPLKIVIFAEADSTLVLALSPTALAHMYPHKDLAPTLQRWERDLRAIFDEVAAAF